MSAIPRHFSTILRTTVAAATFLIALNAGADTTTYPVDNLEELRFRHVVAEAVTRDGRDALRVTVDPNRKNGGSDRLVILPDSEFQDGVIEVELCGEPTNAAAAGAGARGFVGVAFRVAEDASQFELLYLRPTNGRADDQLRRNHTTQYDSFPDYPWHRLRRESPGVYESYVDVVPGEWTDVKIEVAGTTARLYVHGSDQPCLIVNDLKLGKSRGAVALWIGPGTVAHFSNLRVTG